MSSFDSFKKTGIPPKYGQDFEQYRDFLEAVKENRDKIREKVDSWKSMGWVELENRIYPEGLPVLFSLSTCKKIEGMSFSDTKVELDGNHHIYLPQINGNRKKSFEIYYGMKRTQRRNIFGKERGRDGVVPVSQDFAGPQFDDSIYAISKIFSLVGLGFLSLQPMLSYTSPELTTAVAISELFLLPHALYGFYKNKKVRNIYQKGKQLAGVAGREFVDFMPSRDIQFMAEKKMGLGRIRDYTKAKYDLTGYATYDFALNCLK